MVKTKGPKTIELLHMYGSDVNGGQFEWSAELQRQEDGHVYLAVMPTVDEGVEIETPDELAIDSGGGLFDLLSSAWHEHAGDEIDEGAWRELASKVTKFDKALGLGLRARLREEYDPTSVPSTEADLWARRATWERTFTGRAVGYVAPEDMRRAGAVRSYAARYQEQYGALPQGRHLIDADNGPSFEAVFSPTN
jgi:hypothetical protein